MLSPVETMRADAGSANLVVALCPPLTLLFSSYWPIFTRIGDFAIGVAAIAAVASLLLSGKKPSIYTLLIGGTIICLIIVGWVPHDLPVTQVYVQIGQLLAFGVVVSDFRRVAANSTFHVISIFLVGLMLIVNFTPSAWVELIQHNRTWTSPVFGNSNTLGYVFAILSIYCFMSAKVVPAIRMRAMAYLLFTVLLFYIAASGSRGALLMVAVFFSAYLIGKVFKGNKAVLSGGATLTLLMVPVVTLGYPAALGAHVNLVPPPMSRSPSADSPPACVPTSFQLCPGVQEPAKFKTPDRRAGGFLGLKKHIGSGRQKIWPAMIELAGQSPVWGHGLGALPGPYLTPPNTVRHAHSDFLQVYYQFGLIGVALYAFLWCVLFVRAIGVLDIGARSAAVAVLCAACVLATLEVVLIQVHLGMTVALGILATTEFTSRALDASAVAAGDRAQTPAIG